MQMNTQPFFIKVLTPLHAGSGSDLGVVDLPIQRESHTSFPKIEASSLKGAIRSKFTENNDEAKAEAIFGTGDEAGKLGFSDARILFFPVKSVKGVFAYVTCPMVLNRLCEDKKLTISEELKNGFVIPKIDSLDDDKCIVLADKENETVVINKKFVILEEYSFEIQKTEAKEFIKLPSLNIKKERIVIISDDNFKHFVQNSTEVITRIKIDNSKGTVQQGGLFTEEFLPAESVMYALAIGKVEEFTKAEKTTLQIGGDTNLGKGIVEMTIGVKVGDKK
jgi:CRISPR-associated protein Cmr4